MENCNQCRTESSTNEGIFFPTTNGNDLPRAACTQQGLHPQVLWPLLYRLQEEFM